MANDTHRVALVTGGMGGLGEAICIKLAALGYTVVTTYSPGNTKAADWLAAMKKHGLRSTPIPATSPTTIPASPAWRRSPPRSVRSRSWSTTPASRAT